MISFATFQRTGKPNDYVVLPPDFAAETATNEISETYEETAAELYARLVTIISQTPSWTLKTEDTENHQLHFIATTLLMRFKDDVNIQVFDGTPPTTSHLAIYSRSRIGHSDLGANKKRISRLLSFL